MTAIFYDLAAATAYANDFIAEANVAGSEGAAYSSFVIFEVASLYRTRYEVAFTRAFA